ncbi:hypothetical protein B484DRAFT_402144 [Ochromonadaceae sp. CCMP2298]|nr:hypothetical protein B484DRAFT_402144 [Ochromonadaceae sp. CCMP2298]|eukprot:CAMPEP_0173241690 /NCGR_PEP_ID=MMETSP1142-20121109/14516_1 /TAXON_ID=483371 /ORGANISM="non described non described, Strain CCMP2298" /LENGTH=330 /DNA_ID=CAMNT_0014173059 /DNA_START=33 /DNA_END=1025 /DNA_ORIENTATION=+
MLVTLFTILQFLSAAQAANTAPTGVVDTPTLYHSVRGVGVGAFMYSMLHSAAYADFRGWIYGGPANFNNGAGMSTSIPAEVVGFFFGVGAFAANNGTDTYQGKKVQYVEHASNLPQVQAPYGAEAISILADDWEYLERKCPMEGFPRFRYIEEVPVLDSMFSSTFLQSLLQNNKAALSHARLLFTSERAKNIPRVVLHLRRGEGKGPLRARKYSNDGYYFSIVELIRDRFPQAEVHAFPVGSRVAQNLTKEYEGYAKRNIVVHHDTPATDVWAHFVLADFFVMAHSSFSAAAAMLNQNCVIYDHFWHGKMSRYLTLHNLRDRYSECYKTA